MPARHPVSSLFAWSDQMLTALAQQQGRDVLRQRLQKQPRLRVSSCFAGIGTAEVAGDCISASAKKLCTVDLCLEKGSAFDFYEPCQRVLAREPAVAHVHGDVLALLPDTVCAWVNAGIEEVVTLEGRQTAKALEALRAGASTWKLKMGVDSLIDSRGRLRIAVGKAQEEWELVGLDGHSSSKKDAKMAVEAIDRLAAQGATARARFVFKRRHSFEALRERLLSKDIALKNAAFCLAAGKSVALEVGDVHFAGSPCTDFSVMGQQKKLAGPTAAAFLVWVRWIRDSLPRCVVHENVKTFPVEVLKEHFGDLYQVETTVLDPRMFGWPISRPRRYSLLLLKGQVALSRPLSELERVLACPEKERRLTGAHLFVESKGADELRPWCKNFLDGYRRLGHTRDDSAIVDLSQNPNNGRGRCSTKDSACPTITRTSMLWSDKHGRFLTGAERLAAHGIPVFSWAAAAARVQRRDFSAFSDKELAYFSGNGMHAACVGSVYLWLLAYVDFAPCRTGKRPRAVACGAKAKAKSKAKPRPEGGVQRGLLEANARIRELEERLALKEKELEHLRERMQAGSAKRRRTAV